MPTEKETTEQEITPIAGNLGSVTQKDIQNILEQVSDVKKDFIVIFGIFASVVAFLAVEVKVFDIAKTPSQVLGLSCFIIAGLLSFSISIKSILANSWLESLRTYAQPTTLIVIGLLWAAKDLLGR